MNLRYAYLGRVQYSEAWRLQERIRDGILAGREEPALLLLEHHPVITLGRSTRPEHVPIPAEELERRGIEVVSTSRGGSVTFHGPGQLVGYPVAPVRGGIRRHVSAIGNALVDVLRVRGIEARYRCDTPGVWVDEAKLASVGLHVRRGISIHGFALNVNVDLEPFGLIVPCGLPVRVTSMAELCGTSATPEGLADEVAVAVANALSFRPVALPSRGLCLSGSS